MPKKLTRSLSKKRKNNFSRTRKTTGGGFFNRGKVFDTKPEYNTFFFENITNQPNNDQSYEEVGLINIIDSQGINILRSTITEVANAFGKKGYDRAVYNYAIHSLMTKVKAEMEKQEIDKICNSKIHLEFPGMYNSSIYEIIGSFNGTALRKIKQ
jgi:hypothetical protein